MAFPLMPMPLLMRSGPTPRWQTTFNSVILSADKFGEESGYRRTPAPTGGSIVDGTIDILSGALINQIIRNIGLALRLNGSLPNSGWEYLFIADQIFRRQDATYYVNSGSPVYSEWSWLGGPALGVQSNVLFGMA